ncbi:hypothetical protein BJ742DRAFT_853820 [Cladochytrium replicatum]|nr:hypothetical protein BJ742DRAFT_853820 [Cladochytrium replicatum]
MDPNRIGIRAEYGTPLPENSLLTSNMELSSVVGDLPSDHPAHSHETFGQALKALLPVPDVAPLSDPVARSNSPFLKQALQLPNNGTSAGGAHPATIIAGRPAGMYADAIPGDHAVKFSIILDYGLTKKEVIEVDRRHRDSLFDRPQKKKSPAEEYHKFFVTYKLGTACEGKTDILPWDQLAITTFHDVNVNTEFLLDIYERPMEITLWEVVKSDPSDKPKPDRSRLNHHNNDNFTKRTTRVRFNQPATQLSRMASMEALAKRRFTLANTTIPLKQRYNRLGTYHRPTHIPQPAPTTPNPMFPSLMAAAHVPANLEHGFLTNITQPDHSKSVPDLTELLDTTLNEKTRKQRRPVLRRQPHSFGGSKAQDPELDTTLAELDDAPWPRPPAREPPQKRTNLFRSRSSLGLSSTSSISLFPTTVAPEPPDLDPREPDATTIAPQHQDLDITRRSLSKARRSVPTKSDAHARRISTTAKPNPLFPHELVPIQLEGTGETRRPSVRRDASRTETPNTPGEAFRRWILEDIAKAPTKPAVKATATVRGPNEREKFHEAIDWTGGAGDRRHLKKKEKPREPEFRNIVVGRMVIDLTDLFLGEQHVSTVAHNKIEGITQFRASLSVNNPLLSEEQSISMNPMCITILSAESMPCQPVPFVELQKRFLPVFTRFRFFQDQHIYQSMTDLPHIPQIPFLTRHLILPGLLDEDSLRDQLLNGSFEIEVHDRDYCFPDDLSELAKEIGQDGVIRNSTNPKNPYGIASFNLIGLVRGLTQLQVVSPILPCRKPKDESSNVPAGLWLESGATLSINIDLKYPILANVVAHHPKNTSALSDGLYSRIVIVTRGPDDRVLRKIHANICEINASALGLEDGASESKAKKLSSYRLSPDQRSDPTLNILTGYHIFDGRFRFLFIEGLSDTGIADLRALTSSLEPTSAKIWQDPCVTFTQRIWLSSVPGLSHVRLSPSLAEILQRTGTYIRRRMDRECFDALILLQKLLVLEYVHDKSATTVMHLFPTHGMVKSLFENFGEVVDFEAAVAVCESSDPPPPYLEPWSVDGKPSISHKRQKSVENQEVDGEASEKLHPKETFSELERDLDDVGPKLDDKNLAFIEWLRRRKYKEPNFIAMRKVSVKQFYYLQR